MKRIPNAEDLQVQFGGTAMVERKCSSCGCTDHDACVDEPRGPCWWVQAELCSHCEITTDDFVERQAVLEAVGAIGTPCLASQIAELIKFDPANALRALTRENACLMFVYPEAKPGHSGRQFIDYRWQGRQTSSISAKLDSGDAAAG